MDAKKKENDSGVLSEADLVSKSSGKPVDFLRKLSDLVRTMFGDDVLNDPEEPTSNPDTSPRN